jgi:S-layer protein (TIGR01567 family)
MKSPTILIAFLALIGSAYCADDLMIRGEVEEFGNGSSVVWTPQNFAGFYYDIDKGLGEEVLQLDISDQSVQIGDAVYATSAQEASFEHGNWGHYWVLAFLGKNYFVGYDDDCMIAPCWSSLEDDSVLSKVLIDSDSRETISGDQDLLLDEGYKLRFSDSDEGVKVALYKGTALLNTTTIKPPETYVYAVPIGDRNVTLIAVRVTGSVKLKPASYYTIKGTFQISDDLLRVEPGLRYGMMEVSSISGDRISMTNIREIDLSPNINVDLMDGIRLRTADQPNRLYIYRNITEPGTYELRGSVAEVVDGAMFEWNPSNFAGFYYDVDENLGTEAIIMTTYGNTLDEPNGVIYETVAQQKEFNFAEWGEYWTMGFLGENYFAGYVPDETGSLRSRLSAASEDDNMLVDEQLSKVLIDSAETLRIKDGDILTFEEGFATKFFVDNSCEMVFLELYKDNNLLKRDYFYAPDTYVYTTNLGDSQDVAVLAIHVADVNCTGDRTCIIDGIWQISTHPISVEEDTEYDKMTIQSVNADTKTIMMDNEDNKITLNSNKDQLLMGDIRIKTADQDAITATEPLRFYIYTEETVES